ncbi:class I SAM-dependent methyltransferase [Ensifer adhaerens]|jgi:trans-aconitate methyltransferase|uniref:Class I SAM-dependent methyltransferase n=1 Tax=Ensifer adhaerens TaxID=106592 RepID=A0A9Q9DCL5_ENSAD|nr:MULTISPECIES: class I SAM-dependent methyltransferase [Ensifer]MBD9540718.1 class I SAM-dependent methyltransferase [Ensifer sp. ENS04]MBD9560041.1 class I SAM-dependent methyltransferase [Ensifer sp. ENS03]MBD9571812.1 class I SAM-dependent methyltransferase [Ensifer sp. ENS08]MCY1739366.1 class I SAM-dependent methyltransferase [Ensifer sp. SL37]MDF8358144.1 class I SAM-dependent methyltransferase [Ensifer adhaerens]
MKQTSHPPCQTNDWYEHAFDLARGIAAYTRSPLIEGIGRVIAKHPDAHIANAFNHKQVACKVWARDTLFEVAGPSYGKIAILGGWYGILGAMLLEDQRFDVAAVDSFDIDPDVEAVARTLNAAFPDKFHAVTADMYAIDYAALAADVVINTSCEHIADLKAWLDRIPAGTRVLLQSNDYFSEPTHINCVASVEEFAKQAALTTVEFAGALPTKKYTRFMLIGTV